MANSSQDLEQEWRLPKFLSAAEEMFSNLPALPDPTAPSADERLEYQNKLQFLQTIAKQVDSDDWSTTETLQQNNQGNVQVLLPQGPAYTKDTFSKQIAQKVAERAHQSKREELFGRGEVGGEGVSQEQDFDRLMAMHRDQQEKVAEEMLSMTRQLKEQTLAAKTLVEDDTDRIEKINKRADENTAKLQGEGSRISKLASRWNCRCWIWLAMLIVILTFVGMVLLMKLFKKSLPPPPSTHTEL